MSEIELENLLATKGRNNFNNIVRDIVDEHGIVLASTEMDGQLHLREGEDDFVGWEALAKRYDYAEVEDLENGYVDVVLYATIAAGEARE